MELSRRSIEANGIRLHLAEAGAADAPLVLLVHGFPECWATWRHQIGPLAAAGWHVVAPDLRGYGQSEAPQEIAAYNIFELVGDLVGLVAALGAERAVLIGHDWGASITQSAAVMRPDLFHAIGLLSVPFSPRTAGGLAPTELFKRMAPGKVFYQDYFQEPGKAEAELEADVRESMLRMYYGASGSARREHQWRFVFEPHETLLDTVGRPEALPDWLDAAHLELMTQEFTRTGFRGGLNYYRNLDFNWRHTRHLLGARIEQPSIFIGGEVDGSVRFRQAAYDAMEQVMPRLRKKVLLPGIGHWIGEEAPQAVTDLLLEFLAGLGPTH